MALAHCILGKFLGVGCHCFPSPPPLDVPTFSARCLHVQRCKRHPAVEGGTLRGREMFWQISSRIWLPRNSRDLLCASNLRHGTDVFTSPSKEGMLRIFSPLKIWRLRPGFNPQTWVPKASTLPLDHQTKVTVLKNTPWTLSNPIFLPTTYCPALICFGRERGWWITCNYPTVFKREKHRETERVQPALSVG
jgi:hypothetical protein